MTGRGYGGNKQSSFCTANSVPPANIVTYYTNNMSNKELLIKTLYIFEAFYRITQDPDLATVMEKLSGVWYLYYRFIVYGSSVAICPKYY